MLYCVWAGDSILWGLCTVQWSSVVCGGTVLGGGTVLCGGSVLLGELCTVYGKDCTVGC